MAAIVYQDIKKSFGNTDVVKGINLSIENGEFVVFLGPSGCGKTTCLRMLAGLEEPSSGQILLNGEDVTYSAPGERDIAMVFQNYALYPHMTVRENMATGLRYHKVPKEEILKRISEAAKLLDLEALIERKPAQLSGGQRQRVALGRAIVRRPKAFLMDEPLSNLDATLRARMRVELKLLQQKMETTTIYVTHDQVEAMTMAERIAVMSGGHLMQFDTPEMIFNQPASRFVAEFVGSPGINIVPGELSYIDGMLAINMLGKTISLSPMVARQMAEATNSQMHLGVRPQAVFLEQQPSAISFDGRVVVVEPIGTQTHLHLAVGESTIVAAVDASTKANVGEPLSIWIPRAAIYSFHGTDGHTICRGI